MRTARITVTLKPGVLDTQGKALVGGLHGLGFEGVRDVRVGKCIEITLDDAAPEELHAQVDEFCRRLLVNPVTEQYSFTIDEPVEDDDRVTSVGEGD